MEWYLEEQLKKDLNARLLFKNPEIWLAMHYWTEMQYSKLSKGLKEKTWKRLLRLED